MYDANRSINLFVMKQGRLKMLIVLSEPPQNVVKMIIKVAIVSSVCKRLTFGTFEWMMSSIGDFDCSIGAQH